MQYIIYGLAIIFVYILLGAGLALYLLPENLKRYALLVAPMIGYSLINLIGWYCYAFNLNGTDSYAWLIVVAAVLILILSFWIRNRSGNKILSINFNNDSLVIAVLMMAILVLALFPLMKYFGFLTSISLGNNDIADTSSIATFLKTHSRMANMGFLGQSPDAFKAQADNWLFGGPFSTAFFSSIFILDTYRLGSLHIIIMWVLSLPFFYVLAREVFKYDLYSAAAVTMIAGVNPAMIYLCYQGFQGQIIGMGLSMGIMLLNILAIRESESLKDYSAYIPLAALFTCALSLTYNYIVLFVYLPILAYLFVISYQQKNKKKMFNGFTYLIIIITVVFLVSPARAISLIKQTIFMGTATNGWFIPWIPEILSRVFGKHYAIQQMPIAILFVGLMALLVSFRRLYKTSKTDKNTAIIAAIYLIYIVAGYLSLSYLNHAGETWGGYKSFKWITFYMPVMLLSVMIILRKTNVINAVRKQLITRSLLMLLVVLTLGSSLIFVKRRASPPPFVVSKDMAAIMELGKSPKIRSVNIRGVNYWSNLWAINFLLEKKLYIEIDTTYPGRGAASLDGDWDLIESSLDLKQYSKNKLIKINEKYYLGDNRN